jgi:hypothetical protein
MPALAKLRRRFHRPLPALFLVLALLAFVGGALYAPNNYDSLTYRTPRMLHWLAASHWHWITTPNWRMNCRPADTEWMLAPLCLVTRSDRLFFLLSWIAYLLFPGAVFSVLRRLGVSGRTAWCWMWVLPGGYCFAMQAGSTGNDLAGAIYFLAGLHFALRARQSGRLTEVWLATLAAALMTGLKPNNLPLALPLLVALAPSLSQIPGTFPFVPKPSPGCLMRLAASAGVFVLAVLVSYVTTAVLNYRATNTWSGDPQGLQRLEAGSGLGALVGNILQVVPPTFAPPVLPRAKEVDLWLMHHLPGSITQLLARDFPRFSIDLHELPMEESSGLGLGVGLLLSVSAVAAVLGRRKRWSQGSTPSLRFPVASAATSAGSGRRLGLAIVASTWVAWLVYATQVGSEGTARIIAAYYPVLAATVLLPAANARLVRTKWWQWLAVLCAGAVIPGLVLTPSRPLYPALTVLRRLSDDHPNSAVFQRAREAYEVYRNRNDLFRSLRAMLPPHERVVGLIEHEDDMETSLWYPFGSRRVVHWLPGQRWPMQFTWAVVRRDRVATNAVALAVWLEQQRAELVARTNLTSKVRFGPEEWCLVKRPRDPGLGHHEGTEGNSGRAD